MRIAMTMLLTGWFLGVTTTSSAGTVTVKSRTVEYKIGDQSFEGVLVVPPGKAKAPGVLMVHNWLGVSDETRKQAERMARLGLAVLAVDVYGKGVRAKGQQDGAALAATYKGDRKLLRERLVRGLEVLREQKEVDATRTVAVGYCFGGTGVLELARAGADVQAVVSFHGGLDSPTPADGKNIKTRVVVLHGADDPYTKPADIYAFQEEMRSHHVDWQMTVYGGAVHSFTDVGAGSDPKSGSAYDAKADARSFAAFSALVSELFPKR